MAFARYELCFGLGFVPGVGKAGVAAVVVAHKEAGLKELAVLAEVLDADGPGKLPVAVVVDDDLGAIGQGKVALLGDAIRPERLGDVEWNDTTGQLGWVGGVYAPGVAKLGRVVGDATAVWHQPFNAAVAKHQRENFSRVGFAEGGDVFAPVLDFSVDAVDPVVRPDLSGHVVAVDVQAVELGNQAAAIDITAGDGGRAAGIVLVFWLFIRQAAVHAGIVLQAQVAFSVGPAVETAVFDHIDFFPGVLADVSKPQGAGEAVKGETPWVAEPVGINFWGTATEGKWVVGGNGIRRRAVDVQAQHGAEPVVGIGRAQGQYLFAISVIAQGEVEITVKPNAMRLALWLKRSCACCRMICSLPGSKVMPPSGLWNRETRVAKPSPGAFGV